MKIKDKKGHLFDAGGLGGGGGQNVLGFHKYSPTSFMNDLSDFSATPTSPTGLQQLGPVQIHHMEILNL